jgi:hypothetical protein
VRAALASNSYADGRIVTPDFAEREQGMANTHGSDQRHAFQEGRLREWLLALLRFAVTRAPGDRAAALALADDLDSLGAAWRSGHGHFFGRTTGALCDAVLTSGSGPSKALLRRHLDRIEDVRLRRAFRAAVEPDDAASTRRARAGRVVRQELWKGLQPRSSARGHL